MAILGGLSAGGAGGWLGVGGRAGCAKKAVGRGEGLGGQESPCTKAGAGTTVLQSTSVAKSVGSLECLRGVRRVKGPSGGQCFLGRGVNARRAPLTVGVKGCSGPLSTLFDVGEAHSPQPQRGAEFQLWPCLSNCDLGPVTCPSWALGYPPIKPRVELYDWGPLCSPGHLRAALPHPELRCLPPHLLEGAAVDSTVHRRSGQVRFRSISSPLPAPLADHELLEDRAELYASLCRAPHSVRHNSC